jgi:glutamine synthetase type III
MWMALLAACRVHCNWEMGEQAASQILDLEPGNAPVNGLQPSLFAAGGNGISRQMFNYSGMKRVV